MSFIQFQNIVKGYGHRKVLQNFELEIEQGEFIMVVGSKGSGRSTILNMINGILEPDQGRILIEGQDLLEIYHKQRKRLIGSIDQQTSLAPNKSVRKNLGYKTHLIGFGTRVTKQKIIELLELVNLDSKILSQYPKNLTEGQRQRVSIVKALISDPQILLMDDPFSVTDEITRKSLQTLLRQIQKKLGITIIFTTGDLKEALQMGTKVVILNEGNIIQFGSVDEIKYNPKTNYVKRLVGEEVDNSKNIWGVTDNKERMQEIHTLNQNQSIWGITDDQE